MAEITDTLFSQMPTIGGMRGQLVDRTRGDKYIWGIVVLLSLISILVVYSATGSLAYKMYKLGVYEISIGDTIGVAHVGQIESLFKKLKTKVPLKNIAGHFHDTRGQALANIERAYQLGVKTFDSSLGGLGGCPYAPGATGNVSTEDVVYMFHGMKVKTGFNLQSLVDMNPWVTEKVRHELPSRVGKIGILKPKGKVL